MSNGKTCSARRRAQCCCHNMYAGTWATSGREGTERYMARRFMCGAQGMPTNSTQTRNAETAYDEQTTLRCSIDVAVCSAFRRGGWSTTACTMPTNCAGLADIGPRLVELAPNLRHSASATCPTSPPASPLIETRRCPFGSHLLLPRKRLAVDRFRTDQSTVLRGSRALADKLGKRLLSSFCRQFRELALGAHLELTHHGGQPALQITHTEWGGLGRRLDHGDPRPWIRGGAPAQNIRRRTPGQCPQQPEEGGLAASLSSAPPFDLGPLSPLRSPWARGWSAGRWGSASSQGFARVRAF